jgi:putative tryptophan/tyrosine transport system substrate-binding protein
MTGRRAWCLGLAAAALAPQRVFAQKSSGLPSIGFLTPFSVHDSEAREPFLDGLRNAGYIEGKSIHIEWRFAERRNDQLPALAKDLVNRKVAVIVAETTPAVRAAREASRAIPIVMAAVADAVGSGLVDSLARPGANVTGASFLGTELVGKRLELLKEVVPSISGVLVLGHPGAHGADTYKQMREETETAARAMRLATQFFEARQAAELIPVFAEMGKQRSSAILIWPSPVFLAERKRMVALADQHKLPAIYYLKEYAKAGGLLSYGPNLHDLFRRSAGYVDRILKGTRPADMPVQQPTQFELVVNLGAAKKLGLSFPRTILLRADETIQ